MKEEKWYKKKSQFTHFLRFLSSLILIYCLNIESELLSGLDMYYENDKWNDKYPSLLPITVKGSVLSSRLRNTETYPELDEEESILRSFLVKFFESAFFFGELVVDLSDFHSLKQWVTVGGICLSNVDEQVLAVLQWVETRGLQMSVKNFRTT